MNTFSPEVAYLTVIIPVYNEEESLPRVFNEVTQFINYPDKRVEILFVNDGSTDNSQEIIKEICTQSSPFHFIELQNNSGLSAALKAGIDFCSSPFIGYIDADLQTSPMEFMELMRYCESYEMVTGIRQNRKDSSTKVISSRVANTMRKWITNDGVSDTGCPLKILQRQTAKRIPFFKGMHRFLAALVLLQKGRVKEVPVTHYERIEGEAKYHFWNRLLGPFTDLIAFAWIKRRYINYKIKSSDLTLVKN
ncbi:glycosyltransferase [Halosquirtibacter xylanolyticus]|uniref:glycosyltransferase n=1 Tax=Halosquirtibacter xylanolyticus TaxID=3374599 RepID=UPI003747EB0D|nr:glycosyltransferase [Prolixibacteraceae bacterium]